MVARTGDGIFGTSGSTIRELIIMKIRSHRTIYEKKK